MPTTVTSQVRQLSDGNSQGTTLGQSAADLISFYNATPVAQPTLPTQAAIPVGASGYGNSAGALTHYTSTQSPSSVSTITTAEQSITVTGVLSTDLVLVNKPTSQAGLALGLCRVSAANTVKLVFGNATAGTLTPTGSEAYIVTTIPANLQLSATLSPAAVAANTAVEQQFTLTGTSTGLAPGMIVAVNKPTTQAGLMVHSARVVSNNVIGITFGNFTAATLTPTAAESYIIMGLNGLAAASQQILFGINVGTLSLVGNATSSEQSVTEAGIAATDIAIGVQKPTLQAGLLLGACRVSAGSTLKVSFMNATAGNLTPTASEVYQAMVFRPSPGAPMSVFTSTFTPGSVAANTSAEQTFTVTGLTSGQPVHAAPNYNISSVPGVAIGGIRASATNTLAVTFVNLTAAAITPPAGTWTVAQFNQTTPTAGNFVQLLVSPLQTAMASLVNAMRAAHVALGAIKGS